MPLFEADPLDIAEHMPSCGCGRHANAGTVEHLPSGLGASLFAEALASTPASRGGREGGHGGKLGGHDFLVRPPTEQRAILDAYVREYGYRSCLGSVLALERNEAIRGKYGAILTRLRRHLVEHHGGPGSSAERVRATDAHAELVGTAGAISESLASGDEHATRRAPADPLEADLFWLGYEMAQVTRGRQEARSPAVAQVRSRYADIVEDRANLIRDRLHAAWGGATAANMARANAIFDWGSDNYTNPPSAVR